MRLTASISAAKLASISSVAQHTSDLTPSMCSRFCVFLLYTSPSLPSISTSGCVQNRNRKSLSSLTFSSHTLAPSKLEKLGRNCEEDEAAAAGRGAAAEAEAAAADCFASSAGAAIASEWESRSVARCVGAVCEHRDTQCRVSDRAERMLRLALRGSLAIL